ncbi:hypothetical protein FIBSPDRAFT_905929 [Athelia psychrophila]|uniref:Uncharacterized protein n=1 Tax=Athelia psychrophila TaxID=1759441 RepID=A0A167SXV2_9AGAM|nr:hypothetical protein FIBSPDRAFT_905929 [Fibularhizoctonia sp. CBS 109695]
MGPSCTVDVLWNIRGLDAYSSTTAGPLHHLSLISRAPNCDRASSLAHSTSVSLLLQASIPASSTHYHRFSRFNVARMTETREGRDGKLEVARYGSKSVRPSVRGPSHAPPRLISTHAPAAALAPSLSLHHANAISRTPTVVHTPTKSVAAVDVAEIVASRTRHDPSTRNRVPTCSNHIAAHPRNVAALVPPHAAHRPAVLPPRSRASTTTSTSFRAESLHEQAHSHSLEELARGFQQISVGAVVPAVARNRVRRMLNEKKPTSYPYGQTGCGTQELSEDMLAGPLDACPRDATDRYWDIHGKTWLQDGKADGGAWVKEVEDGIVSEGNRAHCEGGKAVQAIYAVNL